MKDNNNKLIKAVRQTAIQKTTELLSEEVEVIVSFFESAPHDERPLLFLSKSLELLSTADVVYFAKDWEKYRWRKIEHNCTIEYGIDTINE